MKGKPAGFFFSQKEIEEVAPLKVDTSLLGPDCPKCRMYEGCKFPRTNYTGNGKKKCLIVAEAMGPEEDQVGIQLVGQVGVFFRDKLKKFDLDLDRDFWKMNAVNCFPRDKKGGIRAPTRTEIKCCRPMVEKAISELKPQYIWLMGGKAVESFFMEYFTDLTISRWRKTCIPDRKYNAYIIPLFHPSYPRRNDDENLMAVYDADLAWAVDCLRKPSFTYTDEVQSVQTLYDLNLIVPVLEEILSKKPKLFFFDYETNHLKGQTKGAKIVSIAFTYQEQTFAFPYQYRDHFSTDELRDIKRLWRRILSDKEIPKLAQNLKFEHSWSYNIFGVEVKGWMWDTMIAAHILDCRSKFTGLKFQTYINFGVPPYDTEIEKYLKSPPGQFNKVEQAPLPELLTYNGLDTLYGMKLFLNQLDQFKNSPGSLSKAYVFFMSGIHAFADIQEAGIHIDEEYYTKTYDAMGKEIDSLKEKLLSSYEAQQYKEKQGKELNIDSGKELGKLFYDILHYTATYTDKDSFQVDKKALHNIDSPFVNDLLVYRRKDKIRNTYLSQFIREVCNGKIYPFFDLHIPVTYRSSSSAPNFQNIPVRDEEAKKVCRSGIIPSPGNQILEADYSGIEVRVAACYTEDRSLIKYITDSSTDMHRDSASDIWMLPTQQVSKMIRFYAKNGWVFPQFYGSYYVNCGKDLWENCLDLTIQDGSATVRDHIEKQGIHTYDQFIEHLAEVEHKFWYERFVQYKQWKDDIQVEFRKQGYIETKLGFRYTGYLSYNEVSNYAIQGTAFHILLLTLIKIHEISKQRGWKTKIIGQIHDSILFDLYPPELDEVLKTIDYIVKEIKADNKWIIVPISMESEITPVDGSWYLKKEIKYEI